MRWEVPPSGSPCACWLDSDHRAAYVLGEILDIDGVEASEILEVPAPTFRRRLSRARDRVRAHLSKECGIVNPDAACRCHRRHDRAQALGRLHPRDREGELDVPQLATLLRALPSLDRAAACYRADPSAVPREVLLDRVYAAVGA